jgi:CMP-N-acetylneuraminic acid synthetase
VNSIAIIPARGGSKGIQHKNIVKLNEHPVIAYSIAAAKACSQISRVIVSTDSHQIADIAKYYGAEVPFMRPAEYATDTSTDREFLLHALNWLSEHEDVQPDLLVHLRATTPLRDPRVIDEAVALFSNSPKATSLRSAHMASKTPYKWFEMDENGFFQGIRPLDMRPEYYNLPRQMFPAVYDPNGYVDILRPSQILDSESVHGEFILGFITPFCHEIDEPGDLLFMNYLAEKNTALLPYCAEIPFA